MKKLAVIIAVLNITACNPGTAHVADNEKEIVKAIKSSIGWALEKDTALLYSVMSNTEDLLIINPDSSTIDGFNAFQEVANSFWLNPKFKATHFELKDLRVTFSSGDEVAWFYCLLDDFAEWDGTAIGWEGVRWTGILEKEDGQWKFHQMHFSFPQ